MQPQPFPYIVPKCEQSIDILYQDDDLLIIHKPDLLLSHPGRNPANNDSVLTRLQPDYPDMHLVHRLDLDTSGIMMIPLHKEATRRLARQFQDRQVEKTYTAVLFGIVEDDTGILEFPIAKNWQHPPLQKICYDNGRLAKTRFEVVERDIAGNRTRVRLYPITGRTHQLRIHTATIGHCILGCDLYATDEAFHMAPRLLLHATDLRFLHPMTEESVYFECPPAF